MERRLSLSISVFDHRTELLAILIAASLSACGSGNPGSGGSSSSKGSKATGGKAAAGGGPSTDHSTGGKGAAGSAASNGGKSGGGSGDTGGGNVDAGGVGGSTGLDASNGDAGAPDANGGAAAGAPQHLADLAGPQPHQSLLVVAPSHMVDANFTGVSAVNGVAGDVFVLVQGKSGPPSIAKYSSAVQQWIHTSYPQTLSIALGTNEEVFFGGSTTVALSGETQTGSPDAIVGKLNPDGSQAWAHQWGSSASQHTSWVAAGPNGSVLASGISNGQAPDNPPDTATGAWLARYEADGTRTFLKQYAPTGNISNTSTGLLVDEAGNAYFGQQGSGPDWYLVKVDPAGALVSDTLTQLSVPTFWRNPGAANDEHPVAWAAGRSAYYEWTNVAASSLTPRGLFKIRLDASVEWYRLATTHTATTDPATGTIWTGNFGLASAISATDDSIYLAGVYTNTFVASGSSVPVERTLPGLVARYDLDGNPIWIQELAMESGHAPGKILSVWPDVDGNLIVTLNAAGLYMFKLNKMDGSLM